MASENRKKAGFFRQISIILWKNSILYRKNIIAIICELIFSSLFTIIFMLFICYSISDETIQTLLRKKDFYSTGSKFDTDEFLRDTYYYYPNEEFVKNIMQNSINLMKLEDFRFGVKLIGTNISDAINLKDQEKKNLIALISFPNNFSSGSLNQDTIEYSIYTTV